MGASQSNDTNGSHGGRSGARMTFERSDGDATMRVTRELFGKLSGNENEAKEATVNGIKSNKQQRFSDVKQSSRQLQRQDVSPAAEAEFGPRGMRAKQMWMELEHSKMHIDELLNAAREEGVIEGMKEMEKMKDKQFTIITTDLRKEENERRKQRETKLEDIYVQACESLESRYANPSEGSAACEDCSPMRKAVLACYRKNMSTPLHCSNEVNAFSECADRARKTFLSRVAG